MDLVRKTNQHKPLTVLAGLVGITAGCGNMTEGGAVLAGLIGGVIVVFLLTIEKNLKLTMLLVLLQYMVLLDSGEQS